MVTRAHHSRMPQQRRRARGAQLAGLFSCSFRLGFVASHWRGVSTHVPCARSRNAVTALALIGAPRQPTYATTPTDGSQARLPLPPCTDDTTAGAPWTVPAGVAPVA